MNRPLEDRTLGLAAKIRTFQSSVFLPKMSHIKKKVDIGEVIESDQRYGLQNCFLESTNCLSAFAFAFSLSEGSAAAA